MRHRLDAYVRESGSRLYRTAYLLTGSAAAAEDLVQTALASVLVSWRRLRGVDNLDAYLHRALLNAARRGWRRGGREVPLDDLPDGGTPDASGRHAEYDHVLRALRLLPPKQRAAVVLHYYEDMSDAAIADVLDCSTGTVRSQVSRGLATLRVLLEPGPAGPEVLGSHPDRTRASRRRAGRHRPGLRPRPGPLDRSGEVRGGMT